MNKTTWILLILEFIIFFGVICGIKSCDNEKIKISEQNLYAANDTIRELELANGRLVYEKSLYILNEKELVNQLNISKTEIKELQKKIGDLSMMVNIDNSIKIDTIYTTKDSIIYINNSMQYNFEYGDEWISLEGQSNIKDGVGEVALYNIKIPTPLTIGLTENYNVFVESKNPYLQITEIEGAIIDKSKLSSKQHWSHGIQFGIGVQYGLFNKDLDIGPQIGYSLQYNF